MHYEPGNSRNDTVSVLLLHRARRHREERREQTRNASGPSSRIDAKGGCGCLRNACGPTPYRVSST